MESSCKCISCVGHKLLKYLIWKKNILSELALFLKKNFTFNLTAYLCCQRMIIFWEGGKRIIPLAEA